MAKNLKISLCIVCMNRLHQLKETLKRNILDNSDYNNLEIILLDYNSGDGLEEWIKSEFSSFISAGTLIYYHTKEPTIFSHSHSKNLAFKLATGDILCSVNADHFTGYGFAAYVNQVFCRHASIVMTTIDFHKTELNYRIDRDLFGKVCVNKNDFLAVEGFDEVMNGYGFEDFDFINRLELWGKKRMFIKESVFLKYIAHKNDERYESDDLALVRVYVVYISPCQSEFLYLRPDRSFKQGTVIDNSLLNSSNKEYAYTNRKQTHFEYALVEPTLTCGTWKENERQIALIPENGSDVTLEKADVNKTAALNSQDGRRFFQVEDSVSLAGMSDFFYLFYNRNILENNFKGRIIKPNSGNFGKATVYRNFAVNPIVIG